MNSIIPSQNRPIDHSYSEFYHLLEMNLEIGAADNLQIITLRYSRMKQLRKGFQVEGLDKLLRLYRIGDLGPEYRNLIKQILALAQSYFTHIEQQIPHSF